MRVLIQLFAIVPTLATQAFQQPALRVPIAISFGAIGGALSRYYLGLWLTDLFGNNFPYGTLFVNLTGSFLMGLSIALTGEHFWQLSPDLILSIVVGFLGSYTTFSSYELDSIKLINQGQYITFASYWLGSCILGLIAIQLGIMLAKLISRLTI
ncbi:MAG: fluoride efflux transporter CrcB [Prochloraceae cyanobacterium]|nr:fluoride efflux transporter CrcB [Prochloraceae cyanobacterium]